VGNVRLLAGYSTQTPRIDTVRQPTGSDNN